MRVLGYKYCERKKTYYSDNHEKPENILYRYKFIDRYLSRELKTHRWIQMSKVKYDEMISQGYIINGTGFEYKNSKDENKTYYEFHVDDHPDFSCSSWHNSELAVFGGNLSVRKPTDTKPLIIFGQDECIFKQYVFKKKAWHGPNGETALVPKDEGQGLMISAFVSRDYGFGFELSSYQLSIINNKRRGESYIDKDAAVLKRGKPTKDPLVTSPFVRTLEYGSGNSGYWSYDDMILQLEDCVDCLKAINNEKYDYLFLFDHSNGHDRLRPDGLSEKKILKYFGGKQPVMRNTKIEDETYLGPFDHPLKLKVGDTQIF